MRLKKLDEILEYFLNLFHFLFSQLLTFDNVVTLKQVWPGCSFPPQ